jgi:cobalamin biosynthesis protein CbiG
MSAILNKKDSHHDNLCDEIFRERAAVLSRAGNAVSEVLDFLNRLENEIESKKHLLDILSCGDDIIGISCDKKVLCAEINENIKKFNASCKIAQLKYYYFIVTREAMGLRRHDRVREIYKIPDEKKMIQIF